MLEVQSPLSAHNPHMNASHFRMIWPPHACPMLLHFCVHFVTQLCHYLANCPRNRATVSRAIEPHACASCATVAHCCALVLALARPSASHSWPHGASCSRAHCASSSCAHCASRSCAHCSSGSRAHYTSGLRTYCVQSLARCSVCHPHMPVRALSRIACAHATSYTLLPCLNQRVRLVLFSCLLLVKFYNQLLPMPKCKYTQQVIK